MLWELPLAKSGLGGIAATHEYVLFGDRDLDDFHDVFRCLDAGSGEVLWEVKQLAIGALDYGNSPRATPLIHHDVVFFFGAHGDLLCVELETGKLRWQKNVRTEFRFKGELPWGYCGSPLLADGKLVVTPGSTEASIVALAVDDGRVVWQTPGSAPAYGSLIVGKFGGTQQIVGLDATSLAGWNVQSGERLWSIEDLTVGGFGVPTPVAIGDKLLVATENNATQLYQFYDDGRINPQPIARNRRLRPDMSSPVVVGNRLFCVKRFLHCLDVESGLTEAWRLRDEALTDYAAIVASEDRMLIIGNGQLLLMNTTGDQNIVARQTIFAEHEEIYSHPALVGDRLFIRGETVLRCISLTRRAP